MAELGKWNNLMAVEESDHGLLLDGGEDGQILMPNRYLTVEQEPGDICKVFVHLDSKDRIVATTEEPLAQVGEFAFLKVVSVNQRMGAFLDWGLAKDLLLPFGEQLGRVREGMRVVVAVAIDKKSNRIIASMRTHRHLDDSFPPFKEGDAVDLLIAEESPMGYKAIIENSHLGLLYRSDLTESFYVGDRLKGFIRTVRPDGKIDLSLNESGYQRVTSLTDDILEALKNHEGFLALGDKSSPDEIRKVFGVSKKAFKQALGALYKKRAIEFEDEGIRLAAESK